MKSKHTERLRSISIEELAHLATSDRKLRITAVTALERARYLAGQDRLGTIFLEKERRFIRVHERLVECPLRAKAYATAQARMTRSLGKSIKLREPH